ncbi:MAG: hypothetical protein NT075_37365 [Chloroflexi bacterium]|nr:hypothetical protein [Chloroflexota bacterium]
MQVNPKIIKIFAVALVASLVLSGCGGGTSGSTWFNLPSIPLRIQPDGSAKVFGFNIGPLLPPATLQQLQTANIQKLEIRLGYNGIHAYANGQDLPYIGWDAASVATLQETIRKMPNVPNANTIADWLPVARQIGLGATLTLPLAQGAPPVEAPRWKGETVVTTEPAPAQPTIGPFKIQSLAFDKEGNATLGSVPLSNLAPIKLDANTLGLLNQLGLEKLAVATAPNGISLTLNDKPLPGLMYDTNSLNQALAVAGPLLPDPALANTLKEVLPKLPGAQLDVAVAFNGQPVGDTSLAPLPVAINTDGTLAVYGVAVSPNPLVPADIIQKLQAAKIQTLAVDLGQNALHLAANGQTLPSLSWAPEAMGTLTTLAQQAGVNAELLNSGLTILKETGGIKANVSVGGGTAAVTSTVASTTTSAVTTTATVTPTTAVTTTGSVTTTNAVTGSAGTTATASSAIIYLTAVIQQGALQSVGGLVPGDLPMLPMALPANIITLLNTLGTKQLQIATVQNKLNLILDGTAAISLDYDVPSLQATLNLAAPFLGTTPLKDPNLVKLLSEQILPQIPGSNVDVKVDVK